MTIPNILSFLRIALIPVFIAVYFNTPTEGVALWPIVVLLVSGFTDILDGFIARRFNMISDLGKMLDPVADKLTQIAVIGCLMIRFPEMILMFVVYITKEAIMLIGGYVMLKGKKKVVPSARWYGKLSTFELYGAMALLLLFPSIGENPVSMWILIGVSLALVLFALVMYAIAFLKTPNKE